MFRAASFLASSLVSAQAHAGLVSAPPPGAHRVGLIVCTRADACPDEAYFLSSLPELEPVPSLLVEALMELDTGDYASGEALEDQVDQALARAREAVARKHWSVARGATDDADRLLDRWAGTVPYQRLFDIYYLRGVARLGSGDWNGHEFAFREAVALAWNRDVRLPVADEPFASAYFAELQGVVARGTGTVSLAASPPDVFYYLDGVELGPGPIAVRVFAGRHRVTARKLESELQWKQHLEVEPDGTVAAGAHFGELADPRWVNEELARALEGGVPPPSVADLLARWCWRHNIHEVRVVRAVPVGDPDESGTTATYLVRQALFDPHLSGWTRLVGE